MMHEQEGIQYSVPVAGQHFQQLLLSVASLYSGDSLELGLSVAYWCAAETGKRITDLPAVFSADCRQYIIPRSLLELKKLVWSVRLDAGF